MSEATNIARSGLPVTAASLVADFRALGIRAGDVLLVHSGLGRLGWVCGGPQAVIEALFEVLGADGTLVMPAHAADWSEPGNWGDPPVPAHWWPIIRDQMPAFDPALTPTRGMGRVAEAFRSGRGVRRSAIPRFRWRRPAAMPNTSRAGTSWLMASARARRSARCTTSAPGLR